MTNKAQCNRHNGKNHLAHLTPSNIGPVVVYAEAPPAAIILPFPPQVPILQPMSIQQIPSLSSLSNFNYFSHNKNGHLGPASLVSLAQFKSRHSAHKIAPQNVYNQILIAQHTSDLTKGQNRRFAHLLSNLQITHPPTIAPDSTVPPIPTSFAEIRTKFTEGPSSIWKNLPHPPVQTDVRSHSYIKISDIIEDFLAHGFLPLQPSVHHAQDWVANLAHAPQLVSSIQNAVAKFGQEPFYFIAFKEWQDDYESHYARTETGSVWCKNITILAEPGTPRHLCTYPIAFSNSQAQHDEVERKFVDDLNLLANNENNMFYSSKLGRQVRVHACLYVSLADQKERRPATGTTQGNSNFHARFGYSINFKAIIHKLPSCPACRAFIDQEMSQIYQDCYIAIPTTQITFPQCDHCYSWLHSLGDYPNVSYPPPDFYPPDELDEQGHIRPFRLSFETLIAATIPKPHRKYLIAHGQFLRPNPL